MPSKVQVPASRRGPQFLKALLCQWCTCDSCALYWQRSCVPQEIRSYQAAEYCHLLTINTQTPGRCAGDGLVSSRNVILRTIVIGNSTPEPVMLAHACLMPPRPHTFTLLDDHGVSWDLVERGQAVKVVPGAVYELTLALDTSDGPWRE